MRSSLLVAVLISSVAAAVSAAMMNSVRHARVWMDGPSYPVRRGKRTPAGYTTNTQRGRVLFRGLHKRDPRSGIALVRQAMREVAPNRPGKGKRNGSR